jgi:thiol:disulfide interchange protein DsbD
MADKGGLIGIFFMAFTLALVSFSCTGPIIGTAIVQAATKGEYLGPFLVMLGFSTGLALPFGLFAAFPAWLNTLPKSGSWMNSVKVVLGFLELALAFKFLSVADMTNGWGFLKYELFMGIWILVFAAMALYLFGFIKFDPYDPIEFKILGHKQNSYTITIYIIVLTNMNEGTTHAIRTIEKTRY